MVEYSETDSTSLSVSMSMAYHPTIDVNLFSIQLFFEDWHSECVWLSGRRNARRKQELSANMVILILGV